MREKRPTAWFIYGLAYLTLSLPTVFAEDSNLKTLNNSTNISDFETRLQLARNLSVNTETEDEALLEYEKIILQAPSSIEIIKEYALLLSKKDLIDRLEQIISQKKITSKTKDECEILDILINSYTSKNKFAEARKVLENITKENASKKYLLKLARAYSWKDKKTESLKVYQKLLSNDSTESIEILIEAADIALAENEHEQSTKWYQLALAKDSENLKALGGLITSQIYSGMFLEIRELLEKNRNIIQESEPEFLIKFALIYAELGIPKDSNELWQKYIERTSKDEKIAEHYFQYAKALMSLGDFYGALDLILPFLNKNETRNIAKELLSHIYLSIERYEEAARYSNLDFDKLPEQTIEEIKLTNLRIPKDTTPTYLEEDPRQKTRVASNLFNKGDRSAAISALENLINEHPYYVPAELALAYYLGSNEEFDRSILLFKKLAHEHGSNRSILLGLARVLSWSKDYARAEEVYNTILTLQAFDPIIHREKARILSWAKRFEESQAAYEKLYDHPVDMKLQELLSKLKPKDKQKKEATDKLIEEISKPEYKAKPYLAFEEHIVKNGGLSLLKQIDESDGFSENVRALHSDYLIQKAGVLEKEAKQNAYVYNTHSAKARYNDLLEVMPWNQEALFDLGQLHCMKGEEECARMQYQKIIEIDSSHTLAQKLIVHPSSNPGLNPFTSFSYLAEDGRGELSGIKRFISQTGIEAPLNDLDNKTTLRLSGDYYQERPSFTKESLNAGGISLGATSHLSSYSKIAFDYSYKTFEKDYRSTNTGKGGLYISVWDYFNLDLEYARSNEIYNFFAIDQRIQADRTAAKAHKHFSREWEGSVRYEQLHYTDNNSGSQADISTAYMLSDHPRQFKIAIGGQHRDTRDNFSSVLDEDSIIDLIHPYWTPQNYYLGTITLDWQHDISEYTICGLDRNYYTLKLISGNDTDQNALIRFEAQWYYDFKERWQIQIGGMVHRSRDWDSEHLLTKLNYRF